MRVKWLGVMMLAALGAGCGEGNAIFVVDAYSFIQGTGADTVPYFIPPGTADTVNVPQRISLPGIGSSIVDSVGVVGVLDLENRTGDGTIGLQLLLSADSAGPYTLALDVAPTTVSGLGTFPAPIQGKLRPEADSLFAGSELWVQIQATGTNGGLELVEGDGVLKSLVLTVVISDKLF